MAAYNEYETVVIIRPDLDDAVTNSIIEKLENQITGNAGHILFKEDWGKKKLAYPILKHQKGHYVLFHFLSPIEVSHELDRLIRIDDNIVRSLSVSKGKTVNVPLRIEQAAEQRRLREEQEKARAANAAARAMEEDEDYDSPFADL